MKKEFKIAIWSGVAGAIVTSVIDLIQSKPFYSSIWFGLKWFWTNIMSFSVPVWAVIIILILSRIKFSNSKAPEFTKYKRDKFGGVVWIWDWKLYSNGWHVENLRPLCTKCNTQSVIIYNTMNINQKCPRCDSFTSLRKSPEDAERIILDNIARNEYPKPVL